MNNINLQLFASDTYWRQREEENLKRNLLQEKEYEREIERIYKDMLDGIQGEIDRFYRQYADKEDITLAEAKKRVSQLDIERYERKAEKYVKEAAKDRAKGKKDGSYFSKKANEEMRLYNLTMKVNRLEMLKANIGLELIKGHVEYEAFMNDILQGRTEEELKRQAGILGETVIGNAKAANAIVNASFANATFSDRIWMYQDVMKNDLANLLQTGLIQGKNPRVLARDIRKYVIGSDDNKNSAKYKAERLMHTELARVQTEAQKQSYIRNGFAEYTYIACGASDCCDICKALDGKHFKIKDMMPGENASPMHPNCHCSTSAYEDSKEYDAWLDYLSQGGSTAEWEKSGKAAWQKTTTNKSKSLEKAGKSSKITVHRSVGAAAKNYQVKLSGSKQHTKLAENQTIEGKTFAGKGTNKEIRVRYQLERDYHIPADEWKKVSGKGYVIVDGKKRFAELHWYEADGEIYEMKVKRYLDEG